MTGRKSGLFQMAHSVHGVCGIYGVLAVHIQNRPMLKLFCGLSNSVIQIHADSPAMARTGSRCPPKPRRMKDVEDTDQTEERIGAPELTDSNGVGCAMRPRPAKDEDVRPEDPEQVGGVRNGVNTGPVRVQRLSSHASILTTRGPPTQWMLHPRRGAPSDSDSASKARSPKPRKPTACTRSIQTPQWRWEHQVERADSSSTLGVG